MRKLIHLVFHRKNTLPIHSGCRYCDSIRWTWLFASIDAGHTTYAAGAQVLKGLHAND